MDPSRRDFLKKLGAAGLVAASSPWWLKGSASAAEAEKPKLPRLKIIFHYGTHRTEEDAENIGKLIEKVKPHVYAAELAFTSERDKAINIFLREQQRSRIARLVKSNETLKRKNSFFQKELELLDKHGVPETVLEVSSEEEAKRLRQLDRESHVMNDSAAEQFLEGKPSLALEFFKKGLKLSAETDKGRERAMVTHANRLAEMLLTEYPELAKEKEIRVLARMGSSHTPAYIALKRRGMNVERYFDVHPIVFTKELEIIRKISLSKKEPTRDDYAAAFLVRSLVKEKILPTSPYTLKTIAAARTIENKLSYKEFEELSQLVAGKKKEERWPAVKSYLVERGIKIPENEKEVDALVRKHYPKMKFGLWHATAARRE